jgi:hypothetical protein
MLHDIRRKMYSINDDTYHQLIHGQLFLDEVSMVRERFERSIPQMTGETGPGLNSLFDHLIRGIGMSNSDNQSAGHCFLDERNRSLRFRSQSNTLDSTFTRLLKPLQFFPLGKPNKLLRVDSSGPVLRRNIGPFEMNPEAHLLEKGVVP